MKKKIIIVLTVFACFLLVLSVKYYFDRREENRLKKLFEKRKAAWQALNNAIGLEVSGFRGEAGIVVKDFRTGWQILHNEEKPFPSASLVKVPIMASCFLANKYGKIDLEDTVILKAKDKVGGSGLLKSAKSGTAFSVDKLMALMICDSDNTSSNMLIDLVGIDYIRNSFGQFGLTNTNLARKIADFGSRNKGLENYTTARDMALILERIYYRDLIDKHASDKCLQLMKFVRTNDRIPASLPADTMVAHKTGLERMVCHDVGIVFTKKGDFLICVLTKHKDKSSKIAKEFISRIALRVYNYFDGL